MCCKNCVESGTWLYFSLFILPAMVPRTSNAMDSLWDNFMLTFFRYNDIFARKLVLNTEPPFTLTHLPTPYKVIPGFLVLNPWIFQIFPGFE